MVKLRSIAVLMATVVTALTGCSRSSSQCDAFADKVMKCDDAEKTPQENDELSRKLIVGMCQQAADKLATRLACMKNEQCPAFNACMTEVEKADMKAALEKSGAGQK